VGRGLKGEDLASLQQRPTFLWDLGRRIVIDTKFNAVLTPGWHREKTLRSGYIYQIYAYLRSQEDNGDRRIRQKAARAIRRIWRGAR